MASQMLGVGVTREAEDLCLECALCVTSGLSVIRYRRRLQKGVLPEPHLAVPTLLRGSPRVGSLWPGAISPTSTIFGTRVSDIATSMPISPSRVK